MPCFNPRPTSSAGRTRGLCSPSVLLICFNPRPTSSAGRTYHSRVRRVYRHTFQSTPHFFSGANISRAHSKGRIHAPLLQPTAPTPCRKRPRAVSIHAPLLQRGELFQPVAAFDLRACFNPRPTSSAGRTAAARCARPTCFNPRPTSSAGRTHLLRLLQLHHLRFNPRPTSSAGRTPRCHLQRRQRQQVSIHAPLLQRGEHLACRCCGRAEMVSIHAPLLQRGEPAPSKPIARCPICFNPRPTSSAGRTARLGGDYYVSIHAPRAANTPWRTLPQSSSFQSTPHFFSGANSGAVILRRRGFLMACFNPRPTSSAGRTSGNGASCPLLI